MASLAAEVTYAIWALHKVLRNTLAKNASHKQKSLRDPPALITEIT